MIGVTGTFAHAQCLGDANEDGHPIFGHLFQRPDIELIGDEQTSARATGVALGDLDGDGDIDAVCTGAGQGEEQILEETYLTVMLNEGDGAYGPPALYKAGHEVVMPALGDFDHDGDLDCVVTNARDDTISVFLNDGSGNFGAHTTYATGAMPRSLVAADFDADGDVDVAVLNVGGNSVSILISHGDGTFAPQVQHVVGGVTPRGDPNPTFPVPGPFLASGDLDNDGDIDLAIPCGDEIRLLVNNGEARFSLLAEPAGVIGSDAYDIAVGDVNGDRLADLSVVMLAPAPTAVNVVINQGGLRFAAPVAYSADFYGCPECQYNFYSIDAGDLEEDGDLDLVVGGEFIEGVVVLRNTSDGTFGPMEKHIAFQSPWVVEFQDVTGDGSDDFIALTYPVRSGVRIYFNDGAGNLIAPDLIGTAGAGNDLNWSLATADLDASGTLDVATVPIIWLFEGVGRGGYTPRGKVDVGEPALLCDIVSGDLNADGLPDLVLADCGADGFEEPGAVRVALQTAPFQFQMSEPVLLSDMQAAEVAIGDMDADGDLDVVAGLLGVYPGDDLTPVDRRVLVLANDGSGNLSQVQEVTFASQTWFVLGALALGDLDGDGDLDAVAAAGPVWTPGVLAILINDGTGTLSIASTLDSPPHPQSIQLRDFDADGTLDIALLCNHNASPTNGLALEPYLSIAMNDGTGAFTFTQQIIDTDSHSNGQLVAADFDNDADIDLALPDAVGFIELHLNDGAGHFGPGARYTGITHTPALAGADLDADGRVDLVGASALDPGLVLFHNRACPPCYADINVDGSLDILDFIAFQRAFVGGERSADCDGDGVLSQPLDFICFQRAFAAGCD